MFSNIALDMIHTGHIIIIYLENKLISGVF
jgi:hypothetical protein